MDRDRLSLVACPSTVDEARGALSLELDRLGLGDPFVWRALSEDPVRGLAVLELADRQRGRLRNLRSFVLARYRAGDQAPRPSRGSVTSGPGDRGEQPPTLAALELAWSLDARLVVDVMAIAIGRCGGISTLRPSR